MITDLGIDGSIWFGAVNLKHFLHIGKTGGTAIKAALEPLAGQFGLIFHRHSMRASDLHPDDDFFFCVRDPVSRYVSAFNSRYRQGQPRYLVPWRAGEQCAFERFSSANNLAESLNSDDEEERRHARDAMRTIQHVRTHQHQWFAGWQMAARAIWIGFTETLSADFDVLKKKLGVAESIALPMDTDSAHRARDELPKHLTERARTNLEWWYQEDIRFVDFLRRHRLERNGGP